MDGLRMRAAIGGGEVRAKREEIRSCASGFCGKVLKEFYSTQVNDVVYIFSLILFQIS